MHGEIKSLLATLGFIVLPLIVLQVINRYLVKEGIMDKHRGIVALYLGLSDVIVALGIQVVGSSLFPNP